MTQPPIGVEVWGADTFVGGTLGVEVSLGILGEPGPPGPGTGDPVQLVDAPVINTDASLGKLFRVTLGGNRTLAKPSNLVDGQMLMYEVKQDPTGNRLLVLDPVAFNFGTSIPTIVLSTAAGLTDRILVQYVLARDELDVIGFQKGF